MKVYTRRGDTGLTGVLGDPSIRLPKHHPLYEAVGTIDELSCHLGFSREALDPTPNATAKLLTKWQATLQDVNSFLAKPPLQDKSVSIQDKSVSQDWKSEIVEMEQWMDARWSEMPPLRQFVLASGGEAACRLHLSRSVCRRAERAVVALSAVEPWSDEHCQSAISLLNRLSDWLFTAAIHQAHIEKRDLLVK